MSPDFTMLLKQVTLADQQHRKRHILLVNRKGGRLSASHNSPKSDLLPVTDSLTVGVVVDIAIRCAGVLYRIANVAHGLFRLALHLLGSTVDLRTRISGQFANL